MREVERELALFNTAKDELDTAVEELDRLSTWYEYFHKAYTNLEGELERRREAERKQKERVLQMQKELQESFE